MPSPALRSILLVFVFVVVLFVAVVVSVLGFLRTYYSPSHLDLVVQLVLSCSSLSLRPQSSESKSVLHLAVLRVALSLVYKSSSIN